MSKPIKTLPKFSNENEEREFWEQHNSTAYLDWNKAERVVLPNLKPIKVSSKEDTLALTTGLWLHDKRFCLFLIELNFEIFAILW